MSPSLHNNLTMLFSVIAAIIGAIAIMASLPVWIAAGALGWLFGDAFVNWLRTRDRLNDLTAKVE